MSAITELPVGRRNVGQTNSLMEGNPRRKHSIVFFRLRFNSAPDSPLGGVFRLPVPAFSSSSWTEFTKSVN